MILRRASRIFSEYGRRCSSVMGQNNSKRDSEGSKVDAMIDDRAKLCERFAEVVRRRCLGEEERESLRAVFEYFAIKSDVENYWTEAMFREFLSGALPSDVASILDATPLFFYSILRIGSYPYQNYPRLTTRLTYDVLSLAIIICLGRYDHPQLWGELGLAYGAVYASEAQKLRRILFQSLTDSRSYPTKEQRENDDDEDLIEATLLLTLVNESSVEDSGPLVPPHPYFPCTDSRRLDGSIGEAAFRSWLRLLLVTQRVDDSLAPSLTIVADWKSLETVTDSMMAAFLSHESSTYSSGMSWTAFDSIFDKTMPNLFTSFQTLLTPFLKPDILTNTIMKPLPPLPDDQPISKASRFSVSSSRRSHVSKTSISSLSSISSMFSSSSSQTSASTQSRTSMSSPTMPALSNSKISTSSSQILHPRPPALNSLNTLITVHRILNYPHLYQLSSFLPRSTTSVPPTALYSGVPESFTPEVFQRVFDNWRRPAVMLVSEECNTTPLAVDFGGRRVWGCFFPGESCNSLDGATSQENNFEDDHQEGFIFQLTPHHRIWRSRSLSNTAWKRRRRSVLGERMTGRKRPRLEMGLVEEDEGRVRFVLSDSLKVGCLTRTSGNTVSDGPGRVAQDNFGVDWMEFWGF